jgi:hypothetical protein
VCLSSKDRTLSPPPYVAVTPSLSLNKNGKHTRKIKKCSSLLSDAFHCLIL